MACPSSSTMISVMCAMDDTRDATTMDVAFPCPVRSAMRRFASVR